MDDMSVQKQCQECLMDIAKYCCSRCKRKIYCSKTCQQKHWKNHKLNCKPTKVNITNLTNSFSNVKIKNENEGCSKKKEENNMEKSNARRGSSSKSTRNLVSKTFTIFFKSISV